MSDGPLLAATLAAELAGLRQSVGDADQAFKKGNLLRPTRDDVVELALVRGMGLFEEFVGDLFYLALQGQLGSEVVPIVSAANVDEAILLVAGSDASSDSRYVSWMPFKDKAAKRADRLLANSQPFGRLANRSSEKSALSELTIVRNRVAHDSSSARAKFMELATARGYPHGRAADYLTSIRGADMEILLGLSRLEALANGLAEPTESGSRHLLALEDPYSPASLAPPGDYDCQRSSHRKTITAYGPLGECALCPRPTKCTHCGRAETARTLWLRQ